MIRDEHTLNIEDIKKQSMTHYNNHYLNKVNYARPNSEQKKATEDFFSLLEIF